MDGLLDDYILCPECLCYEDDHKICEDCKENICAICYTTHKEDCQPLAQRKS
jgi:hypothetical protein